MASISAPYCNTADVAFLLTMARGSSSPVDFSSTSNPSEDVVQLLINNVASRIDMAYMSAGYRIPFTAITSETWPVAQTAFLRHFNMVGVAAYMGGNVASPPVTAPGRPRPSGSLYLDEWNTLLKSVEVLASKSKEPSLALLRAQTYNDTAAEWRLAVSQPMTTDFLEGYYDPTKYDMLHSYTMRMKNFYDEMGLIAPESPDYMWVMHNRLGLTYLA